MLSVITYLYVFFLHVMESQADKSTSNTPTPLGSSQGVKDSNELRPCNSVTQCETNPGDTLDDGEKPGSKRKRSVAWNHFKELIVNGQKKGECNYCQKKLGRSMVYKNGQGGRLEARLEAMRPKKVSEAPPHTPNIERTLFWRGEAVRRTFYRLCVSCSFYRLAIQ